MTPDQILVLRSASMVCATIVLIVAGVVATKAVGARDRSLWATFGILAIAGALVLVGYAMFSNSPYMWSQWG